jgi:hypothetical protein
LAGFDVAVKFINGEVWKNFRAANQGFCRIFLRKAFLIKGGKNNPKVFFGVVDTCRIAVNVLVLVRCESRRFSGDFCF